MKIFIAFLLDVVLGDPRYFCHPIRIMGGAANKVEQWFNRGSYLKLKGFLAVFILCFLTFLFLFKIQGFLSEFEYGFLFEILLLYTTIALHDLIKHGYKVYRELKKNNLQKARENLSLLVGRKTNKLEEKEICRGVLESLSENLVDGVTAPLFYAFIFGLPGAFTYKMINTLDSLWGHQNKQYKDFGFVAAKLDDIVNYLPARLTTPFIITIGAVFRGHFLNGFKVVLRDAKKHPSLNSGYSEAALAGTLGVVLGGKNEYEGYTSVRALMGEPIKQISKKDIETTFYICILVSFAFILFLWFLKSFISQIDLYFIF